MFEGGIGIFSSGLPYIFCRTRLSLTFDRLTFEVRKRIRIRVGIFISSNTTFVLPVFYLATTVKMCITFSYFCNIKIACTPTSLQLDKKLSPYGKMIKFAMKGRQM